MKIIVLEKRRLITVMTLAIAFSLFIATTRASVSLTDLYWISYQGAPDGDILLMAIDAEGHIARAPKVVIPDEKLGSPVSQITATAILQLGSSQIVIWAVHQNEHIVRAVIDKNTLSLVSFKQTFLKTTNPYRIQVTQQQGKNFLTKSTRALDGEELTAFGLTSNAEFNSTRWKLSPLFFGDQPQCEFIEGCGGGVSSDGKLAFFLTDPPSIRTNLMLQPLNSRGRRIGEALVATTMRSEVGGIAAADVTNVLPDGRKFVVYISDHERTHAHFPDVLYIQPVDAETGKTIGARIHIRTFAERGIGQSVAIDPLGRFVVYTRATSVALSPSMLYQALDATGHPSGRPKLLDRDAFTGIDILKD